MPIFEREIPIDISGLGIILHSPDAARHIAPGEDYFTANYSTETAVQRHVQVGSIIGFGTGSPGRFRLRIREGYPAPDRINGCRYRLRLGLVCSGGRVCVRDLYELMDWNPDCPSERMFDLADGIYHVTLCSNPPESGIIGDDQLIWLFLQQLPEFPALAREGIPTLWTE